MTTKYVAGDRIVAYARGAGALGWGVVKDPKLYKLLPPGDPDDVLKGGGCRHRLPIEWRATAKSLSAALPAEDIRIEFNIYHPIRTSVSMDTVRGEQLLKKLSARFGSAEET